MWRNPKFADAPPADQPPAPVENGRNLLTLNRGPGEQLRIALAEYNNHPYLNVRVWTLGEDNVTWWPSKGKGISIRLREIVPVARALAEALKIVQGQESRPQLAGPPPRQQQQQRQPQRQRLPLGDPEQPPVTYRDGFDEFAGP